MNILSCGTHWTASRLNNVTELVSSYRVVSVSVHSDNGACLVVCCMRRCTTVHSWCSCVISTGVHNVVCVGVHSANGAAGRDRQLAGQSQPPIHRLSSSEQCAAQTVPRPDARHLVPRQASQWQLQAVDHCSAFASVRAIPHARICRRCSADILRAGRVSLR